MLYKLARAGLLLLCLAVGTALAEDYDKVYDEPDVSSTTNSHINLWTLGPEHDCMADIAGPIEEGHEAPPDGLGTLVCCWATVARYVLVLGAASLTVVATAQ
jgi:hypothetical protein